MNIVSLLVLFYSILLLVNNNLLTPRIREFITDNKYVSYIALILAMYFSIININSNIKQNLSTALVAFIMLVAALKVDLDWAIIMFIVMVCGAFISQYYGSKIVELDIDTVLTKNNKQIVIEKYHKRQFLITSAVFLTILIGYTVYGSKKVSQYGFDFDILKFIGLK